MNPLPLAIQQAFPLSAPPVAPKGRPWGDPCRHAARPWWEMTTYSAKRRDGPELCARNATFYEDGRRVAGMLRGGVVYTERYQWCVNDVYFELDDVDAALAAFDQAHPLPHPGLRAGQVWAWMSEDGCVEQRVIWKATLDPANPTLHAAIEALPRTAFLMADAACPHLAPWAPA